MSRRLIETCSRMAETTNTLQNLAREKERQEIDLYKNLNADLVSQVYWQIGGNAGTAVAQIVLAGVSHQFKIGDAASAVSIASKGGEAYSSWIRAGETRLQGQQRIVDQKINKGPEKRYDECFQQVMRFAQEEQQAIGRARGG